ncbi:phytanoyl-CoA dioxygenase family protein [Synechococcus sp. MU1648]|uniref:phytanoyl-CoA dioxygenase family protein n=2 Tax=unclassified Synechococcus TaxID=2626047 RepID=UPI001DB9EA0C|nr:phytanoyl-CoA dioxygenase family protein [Synechococcus sp. MU1650]
MASTKKWLMHFNTESPLGPLGWRHCKNAIPKNLIQEVKAELSEWMTIKGSPKKGLVFNDIDRQAKQFSNCISDFQLSLQKNLPYLPSVYKLALSQEIKGVLEANTGWSKSELSPIHNIRVKYPSKYGVSPFTTVPWHQDYGATDPGQSNLCIVTAWIPLTSTDSHNGGIEIIPRSTSFGWLEHRRGESGPEVKDEIMKEVLNERRDLQPIKTKTILGDLILFDQYTLHRSLINSSNQLRWSIDMRYISSGSESGRPGMWHRNPVVGECVNTEVMSLIQQRQNLMDNPETTIRKRVDSN